MSIAAAMVVVVAVAQAWACTAQATFMPLPVTSGPAGTRVAVSGQAADAGPVVIRWNSLAGGTVLATAVAQGEGNLFSTEIAVPDAAPGVHFLVMTQKDSPAARAVFQVTGAGAEPIPAQARAREATATAGGERGMQVGLALLGVGLVALAAGSTAVARRRHARTR